MTLGRLCGETSRSLLALQKTVRSRVQKRQVAALLQRLLAQMALLIDANVERATRGYDEARRGLERANRELTKAIDDLARVQKAIERTATAVDLLGKLAALAA